MYVRVCVCVCVCLTMLDPQKGPDCTADADGLSAPGSLIALETPPAM